MAEEQAYKIQFKRNQNKNFRSDSATDQELAYGEPFLQYNEESGKTTYKLKIGGIGGTSIADAPDLTVAHSELSDSVKVAQVHIESDLASTGKLTGYIGTTEDPTTATHDGNTFDIDFNALKVTWYAQESEPANPSANDMWVKKDSDDITKNGEIYKFVSDAWVY